MPTRKVRDLDPDVTCRSVEHDPPNMAVYEDGVYEHECPECGLRQEFTIRASR